MKKVYQMGLAAMLVIAAMCVTASSAMAVEQNPKETGELEVDFEDDYQPFGTRNSQSHVSVVQEGQDSNHVLLVSNRAANWDGMELDVTDWMQPSKSYTFSFYIKQTTGKSQILCVSYEIHRGESVSYPAIKENIELPSDIWKKISVDFTAPSEIGDQMKLYVQSGNKEIFDYMVDIVSVKSGEMINKYSEIMDTYSLKDIYQDYFTIGLACVIEEMRNPYFRQMQAYQFNSVTYGNEFKPDNMLNQEASKASTDGSPEINYEMIDELLTLARDNGTPIRGHVLVWYSQTPSWFFRAGYENDGELVDSSVMSWRMEQYIKKMLEYTQTNYPGVIYAWDVVNEAADDGGGYRVSNNNWYTVMGESYIEIAYRYARTYADSSIKLFYNDYNEYYPAKRDTIYSWMVDLRDKGLIDGIGMQSHVDLTDTEVSDYLETVEIYGSTGLEVQVTELDIHNPDNGVAGQMKLADKYSAIFQGLIRLKKEGKANITNVTIWGLTDDMTWLTANKKQTSYPLLFDGNGKPKEAFRAVIDVLVPGTREQYQKIR